MCNKVKHLFLGWPNAPSTPELSTEGRMLHIKWKKPVYLGGLNSSLIYYEMYKDNYAGTVSLLNSMKYNCSDTQCNTSVTDSDLKNGGNEEFYVSLNTIKSMSMMCQGYNVPQNVISKQSGIRLSRILGEHNCGYRCYDSI